MGKNTFICTATLYVSFVAVRFLIFLLMTICARDYMIN